MGCYQTVFCEVMVLSGREIRFGTIYFCSALYKSLKGRVGMFQEAALSARHTVFFDSTKSDVMRDLAYSGEDLER